MSDLSSESHSNISLSPSKVISKVRQSEIPPVVLPTYPFWAEGGGEVMKLFSDLSYLGRISVFEGSVHFLTVCLSATAL